jgi:hypothetical protein
VLWRTGRDRSIGEQQTWFPLPSNQRRYFEVLITSHGAILVAAMLHCDLWDLLFKASLFFRFPLI